MSLENKLARPYAKAIFELANSQNNFAFWTDALRVAKEIAEHPSVIAMIKNPTTTQEKSIAFFKEVGGDVFDASVHRLLTLLASNKRLLLLGAVFDLYESMRKEAQQLIDVEVTSARALTPEQEQKLAAAIKKRTHKNVQLHCKTDSSILGGAIIRAGDWEIDGTVRGRLAKIYDAIGIS